MKQRSVDALMPTNMIPLGGDPAQWISPRMEWTVKAPFLAIEANVVRPDFDMVMKLDRAAAAIGAGAAPGTDLMTTRQCGSPPARRRACDLAGRTGKSTFADTPPGALERKAITAKDARLVLAQVGKDELEKQKSAITDN